MSTVAQWWKDGMLGSQLPIFPYGVGPFQPTSWDDMRTPLLSATAGPLNPAVVAKLTDNGAGSDGVYAYDFSQAGVRDLIFVMQMTHRWKQGTTIHPHIHWTNKTDQVAIAIAVASVSGNGVTVTVTTTPNHNLFTGAQVTMAGWAGGTGVFNGVFTVNVTGLKTFTYLSTGNGAPVGGTLTAAPAINWGLEYSVATINAVFPNSVIFTCPAQIVPGTVLKHILSDFPTDITMAGNLISTMLACRVFRDPTNAVDTYTHSATGLELDFHFEIDSFGSNQELVKNF